MSVNEPDLELLVLLELFLDTDPDEREAFLTDVEDEQRIKLLALIIEETGGMP